MSKQPWLRLYRDSLHNPKVVTLSDRQHRAWVNCMLMSDNDGYLPSLRDVAVHMRVTRPDAEQLVCELVEAGLVDPEMLDGQRRYRMHDWDQHQAPSDNAAERMRKLRENRRAEHVPNCSEHVQNSYGTESYTDRDTDRTLVPSVPVAAREKAKELSFDNFSGKVKGKGKDDGISTLTKRAEGLGVDVGRIVEAVEAAKPDNYSAYFTKLCVNELQGRLPGVPEQMIRDALWKKSPQAYTGITAALLMASEGCK